MFDLEYELTLFHLFAYGESILAKPTKRGKYNIVNLLGNSLSESIHENFFKQNNFEIDF